MCLSKQSETNLLVIDANMAAATPSPEYLAETRGPMIRTVTWLSVIFPILFVGLRVYTRLFVRKVFGLDDWVILLSLVRSQPSSTPHVLTSIGHNRFFSYAMAPSSKLRFRKVSVDISNGFSPSPLKMPSRSHCWVKSHSPLSSCHAHWARHPSQSVSCDWPHSDSSIGSSGS